MNKLTDRFVNAVLFPFGRCRVTLGEWPETQVETVIDAIEQRDGVPDGAGGMIGLDEYYFRMRGGRVKLGFEFGEAYLWGPKNLVRELVVRNSA